MYNEKGSKNGNVSFSADDASLEKTFIRHAQQQKIGKQNN